MYPSRPVVGVPGVGVSQRAATGYLQPSVIASAGMEAGAVISQHGGVTFLSFKRRWNTGTAADGVSGVQYCHVFLCELFARAMADCTRHLFVPRSCIVYGVRAQVILKSGATDLVWAFGSGNAFGQHVTRGIATEFFVVGTSPTPTPVPCVAATTCAGRGTCNSSACVCGDGYAGAGCATCATGFDAGAGGICSVNADTSATASLTVVSDAADVGTEGSAERDAFIEDFEDEMGAALGAPGRIVVTSVTLYSQRRELAAGPDVRARRAAAVSVAVQFTITAVTASAGGGPSVAALVSALKTKAASGTLNCSACPLLASAPPQAVAVTFVPPPAPAAGGSAALSPGVTLAWSIEAVKVSFTLTVSSSMTWVALGFSSSKPGAMVGSDVVIADASGLQRVKITSQAIGGLDPALVSAIYGASVVSSGGATKMTFTRPLAAVAAGDVAVSGADDNSVVWAHGEPGDSARGYHGTANRGAAVLNLRTGAVATPGGSAAQITHAVLMILAWGILLPGGVISARCFRHRPNACWFKWHRAAQVWRAAQIARICRRPMRLDVT